LTKTQEAFVAAMVRCGSVAAACREIGISARTGWRWMGIAEVSQAISSEFVELADRLREQIGGVLAEAVQALAEIMRSPEEKAAVRVAAASAILSTAARVAMAQAGRREGEEQRDELLAFWERVRVEVFQEEPGL